MWIRETVRAILFTVTYCFLLAGGSALADQALDDFKKFGLLGGWSKFCNSPANGDNVKLFFFEVIPEKTVIWGQTFDPKTFEMHRNVKISDTEIFQNGQAFIFWYEEPGSAEVTVWRKLPTGKIRALFDYENHKLLIFDGMHLERGIKAPELERCRDAVYDKSK
jgi:hypothetical protein